MFQLFFQISSVIKLQFVCSSSFVYLFDLLYNKSRTKATFYVFHSITKNIWLPLSFIFHTRMHVLVRKHMLFPVILNYSVLSGNTVTDTINLGRTATLQKKQNRTSGTSSWKMTEEHWVLENMRNWLFCWLIGEIWLRLHGRRDLGITALCMLYMRIFSCLMIHLLFYIHPSTICSWLVLCLNKRFFKKMYMHYVRWTGLCINPFMKKIV